MPSVTPAQALVELLAGNERFVAGAPVHPNQDAARRATVAGQQRPFAVVFGCSDSRLAAEIIFDRGLGDLFVIRTAGHIVGGEVQASLEYGVVVLGAPLVVVLGHDSCGAVQATLDALDGAPLPAPGLAAIVEKLTLSVVQARQSGSDVAEAHVRRTVALLSQGDTGITAAVRAGQCAVVGMTYRLADGRVTLLPQPSADLGI